jgi:hypothetical protein
MMLHLDTADEEFSLQIVEISRRGRKTGTVVVDSAHSSDPGSS